MDPETRHIIKRGEIEHILTCLRFIDASRVALEKRNIEGTEEIIKELRNCSGGIYEIVKDMPHAD